MAQNPSSTDADRPSHAPGSQPAHFEQPSGAETNPGRQPDEVEPSEGDDYEPGRTPDEVAPDQGDFDRPMSLRPRPRRSPTCRRPRPRQRPIEPSRGLIFASGHG
jgi:hypothetical protein